MDKSNKFEIIKREIESALGIVDQGISNGKLSNIERDLLLEKLRKTYDLILLDNNSNINIKREELIHNEVPSIIDDILETKMNDKTEAEIKEEPIEEKKKLVVTKSKSEEKKTEQVEIEPEISKNDKEPIKATEDDVDLENNLSDHVIRKAYEHEEVKTVADTFENKQKPSINDILGDKQKARDLASKYADQAITNLKASITINDKIWFIKELFDGDTDLYNETLKQLNDMQDLDEALSFLNENFEWDQQKDSFQSFLELLFRRFLPEEIES